VKTGHGRAIPLVSELVTIMKFVIGSRSQGLVFLHERLAGKPLLTGGSATLIEVLSKRCQETGRNLTRTERHKLACSICRDAGVVSPDEIRNSFCRIMRRLGHPEATCPKSLRYTFATLLQDGNVDPLVRQLTLGHAPTAAGGLGMTATYTHTRPETQKQQIEQALRRWSASLVLARTFTEGGL
jgi:integrase